MAPNHGTALLMEKKRQLKFATGSPAHGIHEGIRERLAKDRKAWSKGVKGFLNVDEAWILLEQLTLETDRGCVLVISAYIETSVRDALIAKCTVTSDCTEGELNKLFKSFDSQFANFTSCIRLAHALGIIDRTMAKMLIDFAAWRNKFAHQPYSRAINAGDIEFTKPAAHIVEPLLSRDGMPDVKLLPFSMERITLVFWASYVYVTLKHEIHTLNKKIKRVMKKKRSTGK